MVEAGRPWAVAVTRKYQWPVAIALLDRDAVVVRFSTVPDSSMSPFHKTVNMRLPLLTRGMGLAYLAFTPKEEFDLIIEMLRRSDDPEDTLAQQKDRLNRLVQQVRRQGYASRARHVEPKNSNTSWNFSASLAGFVLTPSVWTHAPTTISWLPTIRPVQFRTASCCAHDEAPAPESFRLYSGVRATSVVHSAPDPVAVQYAGASASKPPFV